MDFAAIVLFLVLYYVRPHEWIGAVASLRLAAVSLVIGIVGTLMRERGFNFRQLLQTPHDWVVLAFVGWAMTCGEDSFFTVWSYLYAYALYYLLTVQALSYGDRIQRFLNWWTVMIVAVAALAVASEYGFDPMDSYQRTHWVMKGRLVLNTWIFNNPNALGHSIVPVLIMLYFICFWKRPIFTKIATIPIVALPLYCIYLTQSKGAYLSAFAAIIVMLTFNRPKRVQIFILVFACTLGWTAMQYLPRMDELNEARKEEGIQGRMAAFQWGLKILNTKPSGVGYGKFVTAFKRENKFAKASHSSYVQVGTETGRTGLFLFLGMIYCCFRTLITCKAQTVAEERIRRILFAMLVTYSVSSWMVDWGFRASFFLMAATVAAFHRQLLRMDSKPLEKTEQQVEAESSPVSLPIPALQPAFATANPVLNSMHQTVLVKPMETLEAGAGAASKEPLAPGITWRRWGVIDFACVLAMTFAAEAFWRYIMRNI